MSGPKAGADSGLAAAGLLVGCPSDDGDGAAPQAATRPVRHALGEAEAPVAPGRVLPWDSNELESVVALGFDPVGTTPDLLPHCPLTRDVRAIGAERLAQITVGTFFAPGRSPRRHRRLREHDPRAALRG